MVGSVRAHVPQHHGRIVCGISGRPDVSGVGKSERGNGGEFSGSNQRRKRSWPHLLGVVFGPDHQKNGVLHYVSRAGDSFLDIPRNHFRNRPYGGHIHHPDVLRGAYGITPAFAADYFGPRNVGPIFGLMLFPWAFAAAFGPLFFAYLRQTTGGYNQALYLIAGLITVSMILPIIVSPPRSHKAAEGLPARGPMPLEPVTGSESKG